MLLLSFSVSCVSCLLSSAYTHHQFACGLQQCAGESDEVMRVSEGQHSLVCWVFHLHFFSVLGHLSNYKSPKESCVGKG